MKSFVVGFGFTQPLDQVLLIKKAHPDFQRGKYNGVGGKREPGEDSLHAMRREWVEETNMPPALQADWKPYFRMGWPPGIHYPEEVEVWFYTARFDEDVLQQCVTDTLSNEEPCSLHRMKRELPVTGNQTMFGHDRWFMGNLDFLIPMAYHFHKENWILPNG